MNDQLQKMVCHYCKLVFAFAVMLVGVIVLVSCRFCKSLFLRLEEELSAIRSAVSNLNSQDHDRLGCLGQCSIIHVGSSDIASTVTYQVQVFMSY